MSERLRCVMVGLGSRGQYLLQLVMEHPNYEVVALAEPNPDLLNQARRIAGTGEENCYADLELALCRPDAQACVINTPPHLHKAHLEASFSHNLPALIAKPLTRDLADARQVVEVAEERKLALVVDQQIRFSQSQRLLTKWIAEGKYGKLGFGTYCVHRYRPSMDNANDGSPFLWEQGVHSFNSLLVMFGRRALRVQSYQTKPSWSRYNGSTVAMGIIEFEGAEHTDAVVPIQFIGSYASSSHYSELHLEFEGAAVRHYELEDRLTVACPGDSDFREIELPQNGAARALEQYNLDNFYLAVRDGAEVPNTGRENMRTLAVVDAFIQSSRTGRAVDVADVG